MDQLDAQWTGFAPYWWLLQCERHVHAAHHDAIFQYGHLHSGCGWSSVLEDHLYSDTGQSCAACYCSDAHQAAHGQHSDGDPNRVRLCSWSGRCYGRQIAHDSLHQSYSHIGECTGCGGCHGYSVASSKESNSGRRGGHDVHRDYRHRLHRLNCDRSGWYQHRDGGTRHQCDHDGQGFRSGTTGGHVVARGSGINIEQRRLYCSADDTQRQQQRHRHGYAGLESDDRCVV